MVTEQEIVILAAKGDDDAFEQLVKAYERRIYTMALRMCGNADDAYDIAQETFIRVYRSLPSFKGDSKFSTWIYRIASNLCVDHRRKFNKIIEVSLVKEDEESQIELPDTSQNPEEQYERTAISEEIAVAILELSPEHREIFLLREIEGLSYDEISDLLDVEQGTVKSRIFRARRNLRDILILRGNISDFLASNTAKEEGV